MYQKKAKIKEKGGGEKENKETILLIKEEKNTT